MYKGKIVELAESEELYQNPLHAYTKSLLSAIPLPDPDTEKIRKRIKFDESLFWNGEGEEPILREVKEGHWVSCTEQDFQSIKKQFNAV